MQGSNWSPAVSYTQILIGFHSGDFPEMNAWALFLKNNSSSLQPLNSEMNKSRECGGRPRDVSRTKIVLWVFSART